MRKNERSTSTGEPFAILVFQTTAQHPSQWFRPLYCPFDQISLCHEQAMSDCLFKLRPEPRPAPTKGPNGNQQHNLVQPINQVGFHISHLSGTWSLGRQKLIWSSTPGPARIDGVVLASGSIKAMGMNREMREIIRNFFFGKKGRRVKRKAKAVREVVRVL
jgi:hypothetical protein